MADAVVTSKVGCDFYLRGQSITEQVTTMAENAINITEDDAQVRRLFQEIEHEIKMINREKISGITGTVSRKAFIDVASTTAKLRACYLAKVIELESSDDLKPSEISTLRGTRLMYEEALEGFSALQHALKRGYFDLTDN
ncbi:MAG: hypothetical protein COB77_02295 [Gammaproteobacteria bacterium]|nr:MAG: hypothetical protein COB77_02295 [Gammaproteobacteria bacterium]